MKYREYHWLQEYVHRGYRWQMAVLRREWSSHAQASALQGGPRCLELACGGGNLAGVFPPERYLGLDVTPERVVAAAAAHPDHTFITGDVTQPDFDTRLKGIDFVFCHGLLHHLDDAGCAALLARIERHIARPGTVVTIEPLLPDPWKNPPGYLLCRADDGKFIRKSQAYKAFLDGYLVRSERHSFLPRWPVSMDAYVARYV
jgi:SAM-dependent methyltransferase